MDVYSFGVVLLELTTGKEAADGGEHGCLAEWARHHYRSGASITDSVDKCIKYAGYHGEIETVFRLGVTCTGNSPSSRPTMKDVLQILLKCSEQTRQKRETGHRPDPGVRSSSTPAAAQRLAVAARDCMAATASLSARTNWQARQETACRQGRIGIPRGKSMAFRLNSEERNHTLHRAISY